MGAHILGPPARQLALVFALLAASACECAPARSKPWRHDRGGEVAAPVAINTELVAAEARRAAALARRAHTLRIHMDRRPRHLNPMVDPSLWTERIALDTVFETLIRYEPPPDGAGAGPGSYRPGLARSWRVSFNGREITIDLQPDVKFHDGRRMSSVDVQFSLDTVRDPRSGAGHLRAEMADVIAVELVTARSLRIRLTRPNGYVLRALAAIPILPSHVYQGRLTTRRGPIVGTGPYVLASFADEAVHLTRFAGYWGQAPAIADVEFVYQPDAARALTMAKRGELDLIPALIPTHYPEQASAPGLVSSFVPLRLRPPRFRYLVMAAHKPPLDDARMRHALALLIDRAALVKEVHGGLARPVAGPIWPGGPGDGAAPAPPPFDPGQAGQLMDQAGYGDGDGDGVRERDGKRLGLSVLVRENADRRDVAERELLLRSFRRSSIPIEIRAGTPAVLRNRLRTGEFELAFIEWRGSVDRDLAPLFETGGAQNFGRFSNPRVDAALAALRGVWQPSSRAPLMAQLARAIAQSWPITPLVAPSPYGLLHRRVRGGVVWNGWLAIRSLSLVPERE